MIEAISTTTLVATSLLDSVPYGQKIITWFGQNAYLGWILFIGFMLLRTIWWFVKNLPQVDTFKAQVLTPLAKNRKFKRIRKATIRSDIKGQVNKAVRELQSELPNGWIREMDVEWVHRENAEDFLDDNEIVIRTRPYEDQNRNLANVTYHFLKKCCFPKVKKVIPDTYREAVVLYIGHRIIKGRSLEAENAFVDHIMEPVIDKKNKVIDYFEAYKNLDKRGMFTGPLLRDMQHVAKNIRTTSLRKQMGGDVSASLKYYKEFNDGFKNKDERPDSAWSRKSLFGKSAIILVANPFKTHFGTKIYVNKALKWWDAGADRIYVLGGGKEKIFVNTVIRAIEKETNYILQEVFDQHKDYRGMQGGTGAMFVKVLKQDI